MASIDNSVRAPNIVRLLPYVAPRLASFGCLTELTSGGSGKASEGEKGMAKPRP